MGDYGRLFAGIFIWLFVAGVVVGGLAVSGGVYAYHHLHIHVSVTP